MAAMLAFCTCPDAEVADRIAAALVAERLAACVNQVSAIATTYRWKGAVHRATEVLLLIKTTRERFDALRDRIVLLHPYELPEVIAVDIALGLPAYLQWISAETARASSP